MKNSKEIDGNKSLIICIVFVAIFFITIKILNNG